MRLSNISYSPTLEYSQTARSLVEQGEQLISLGLGDPDIAAPQEIITAVQQAVAQKDLQRYIGAQGLAQLRELIATSLQKYSVPFMAQNILITAGAKQANYLALLSLLEQDDEVIVFTPAYVSFIPQVQMIEPTAKIHTLSLDKEKFTIDFTALEAVLSQKTKVLILNSPHNPTGKIFSKDTLERLAQLANTFNFYIISDEVYASLPLFEEKHQSIASLEHIKQRVIVTSSFSKSYAVPGFRVGFVAAPEELLADIRKAQQHLLTCVPSFLQKGMCAAFSVSQEFFVTYKKMIQDNLHLLQETIATSALSLVAPQGGMFAFVDISQTMFSSDKFCTKFLHQYKVAILPGKAFGKEWDTHIRISLAVEKDVFAQGMHKLQQFLESLS